MIKGSCHCGAVTIEFAGTPKDLNSCQCSICRRYGTLWAYDSPKNITIDYGGAEPDQYVWGDKEIAFNRCKGCGCVTHWSPIDETLDRMGVNARMFPREVMESIPVRRSEN